MAGPCEYVIAFKPLWTTLSVYAAWPQRITESGQLVRSAWSLRTAVTAAVFCVSAWRSWVTLAYHIKRHSSIPSDNVPLRLLNIQFGVYVLSFGILVSFLFETARTARYAQLWHHFQPRLVRACGRGMRNDKLRLSLRYTAVALSVGWPLAVIVPIVFAGEESPIPLEEILFQSYITTVLTLASTSWRMHCAFLLHASTMLVDAVAEAVRSDSLGAHEVAVLSRTWVELREMVHAGARSLAPTAFLNIFILSLTFVLCTFNTLYNVLNGYSKMGVFLSGVGLLTGATLVRIFNSAHRVSAELSTRAIVTVAGAKFSRFSGETLEELHHLRLILVNHPVSMILFGLLRVNRGALGGLMVVTATYLVVLVQYAVSR